MAVLFNFQAKQACLDLASKLSTKQVCGSVFNHGAFSWAWLDFLDLDLLPSSGVGFIEVGLILVANL